MEKQVRDGKKTEEEALRWVKLVRGLSIAAIIINIILALVNFH